jgi:hypothetical protein
MTNKQYGPATRGAWSKVVTLLCLGSLAATATTVDQDFDKRTIR